MYFAQAVPGDGEVVSIEKFDKFAKIARRNFELNGLASKIKLFDGDAFEVIDRLPRDQLFDLVFIDGNKERCKDYVIKTEPLLARNGIMIVDDCFYHGDVLNAQPSDAKGVRHQGLHGLSCRLQRLAADRAAAVQRPLHDDAQKA